MKLNFAPLCGAFKRHSPSMHPLWLLFCAESYRTKPAFLCKHCSRHLGANRIKALARSNKPFGRRRARLVSIDEWKDVPGRIITKELLSRTTAKKPKIVWLGLDLSEGKDITAKIKLSQDGYTAEYLIIDETPPKEETKNAN